VNTLSFPSNVTQHIPYQWLIIVVAVVGVVVVGRNSSVCVATMLRAWRSGDRFPVETRFPHPLRPSLRPTQPPRKWLPDLSRRVNRPGRGVYHPTPSNAEVKERVELYRYSPSGASWSVLKWTYCCYYYYYYYYHHYHHHNQTIINHWKDFSWLKWRLLIYFSSNRTQTRLQLFVIAVWQGSSRHKCSTFHRPSVVLTRSIFFPARLSEHKYLWLKILLCWSTVVS